MTRSVWSIIAIITIILATATPGYAQATFQGLGDLPGGAFFSQAWGTSADGAVVVGQGTSPGFEAFRWTSGGGMVGLGDLPGGTFDSEAFATSADGAVVVGVGLSAFGLEAFLWTADDDMRLLKDILVNDFGLDLTGWGLREATGISADGVTIVGWGTNGGNFEAWMATIPTGNCPWDLDGTGSVGVKDLLFLLGTWGPCPPKEDCSADFDNTGDVGVKDLLVLLGAWGPCP
ncbi:MAG: hypothetical protein IIC46_09120 [Planctomycetes bacterium]|nr:hypothetical protein [Planctomycetota bacterium]